MDRSGPTARRRSRAQGFTLLEAIVTLVVVSLLVMILMQALSQAMNLRTRLLRFEGESRQAALQEAWFREVTAGMQRDLGPVDELDQGQLGTREQIEYTTSSPLAASGFATVRWWLAEKRLHYSDSQSGDVVIVGGPLQDAGFAYLDEEGEWVDEWRWRDHSKPPRIIRFTATTARGDIDWLVPVMVDGLDLKGLKLEPAADGI